VFVTPATIQLAGAEVELVSAIAREMKLKEALTPVREAFDYIFIDCPPSLGVLTINALAACDSILVPIQCEYYALEGVTKLLESMKMVKKSLNPQLDIFGVLMTMYDSRTSLSKQVAEEVKAYFGDKMFSTMIPRNVRVSEAPSYGKSVIEYDRNSKGAEAYLELAKEVVKRG
jgi:chromosome partitioning protein